MFSSVNTCWTLVGAFLVYFMQAGFALCEAGFTRAKNTGNILMKNMMDFCIGTPCYWLIGFGLMFGGTGALIGGFDPFIQGDYSHLGLDIPLWVYIVFQTVFCATAATIVSGSMAERTNFKAYCVYSAAISLVVYPICGHWMWGGGWLQSMGFHDFAGSAAVHNVGGAQVRKVASGELDAVQVEFDTEIAEWPILVCGKCVDRLWRKQDERARFYVVDGIVAAHEKRTFLHPINQMILNYNPGMPQYER